MPYNIILIEDDELQRNDLKEALEDNDEFGSHSVKAFRDLVTFEAATKTGELDFEEDQPLLVILDIMLAADLDPANPVAPRWKKDEPPSAEERHHYVDDELGLGIATDIRNGNYASTVSTEIGDTGGGLGLYIGKNIRAKKYTSAIPAGTPILFFTARQNTHVKETIEKIKRSDWLVKPQFSSHIQETIDNLMRNCGVDTIGGNNE